MLSRPSEPTVYPVKEHYFESVVDHYNFFPTPALTSPLRYLVNDKHYRRLAGPCFFYAGNEANIVQFVNNIGFVFEAAAKFGALVVFAEHRYYGKILPLGVVSLGSPYNASLLTVEQAMADLNSLSRHIRDRWSIPSRSAFVAFGGSYSANLALWMRLKNPNIWAGAVASSATPLKHFLRTSNGFAQIETEAYGNVSSCYPDLVREGWTNLYRSAATE